MSAAKQERFITEGEYHELQCNLDSARRINAQLGKGELNRIRRIEELEKELEEANRFRKNAGVAVVIAQERIEALEAKLDEARTTIHSLSHLVTPEPNESELQAVERIMEELDNANQSIGHWGGKWGGEVLRRCEAEARADAALQDRDSAMVRLPELQVELADLRALFEASQRSIREIIEHALGYEMVCDAQTAVHRLARAYAEAITHAHYLQGSLERIENAGVEKGVDALSYIIAEAQSTLSSPDCQRQSALGGTEAGEAGEGGE